MERCEKCGKIKPDEDIHVIELGGEEFVTCTDCLTELADSEKIVIL